MAHLSWVMRLLRSHCLLGGIQWSVGGGAGGWGRGGCRRRTNEGHIGGGWLSSCMKDVFFIC